MIFQVSQEAVYLMLAEKEIWMMCMVLVIRHRRRPISITFKTVSGEMKNLLKIIRPLCVSFSEKYVPLP